MNEIKVLDKATIDKIAAGEVVERPANVVKELMENSIDAGSSAISVEIRDGGKSLIRITDNGCGIPMNEVKSAFLRHSTSKIRSAEDLSFVTTLGFRGEALSSIAAVSDLEICTKTSESLIGCIYKISAGEEISLEEAGLPDGTTIIITNLFKSLPARLKFLNSNQIEGNSISDAVEKIALSHPDIAIKFTNNGAVRLNTSGNGSLKDVIYSVYGKEMASNLLDVYYESELLSIKGYIGKPEVARGSRSFENFFVNGRYVKDRILSGAVENAYKGYQMKGSFPFIVFNISIEPELIDVNVHPTKTEIRFYNNEAVYECVSSAILEILKNRENIPEIKEHSVTEKILNKRIDLPEPFEKFRKDSISYPMDYDNGFSDPDSPAYNHLISKEDWKAYSEHVVDDDYFLLTSERPAYNNGFSSVINDDDYSYEQVFREHVPYQDRRLQEGWPENPANENEYEYEQQNLFDDKFISKSARPAHNIIGCVFNTYWIVEYDEKMFIIDQHAAHEKVLYERFISKIREQNYASQLLAPGIVVTVTAAQEQTLVRYMFQFEKLGFAIDHFGGNEYIITAVPADLYNLNNSQLFISMLDELCEDSSKVSPEILENRIATAACKAAVKGGKALSIGEANALIDELLSLDNPYNCPHGRPTIISMSKNEIEKKFKRIV